MTLKEITSQLTDEQLLLIGSAVHSGKIKKGYKIQDIVLNLFIQNGFNAKKGTTINFTGIQEKNYSQETYTPDINVELTEEIWILDTKSDGWNNNTPVSDTVKKYKFAKEETEKKTDKKVRFIMLKNTKGSNHFEKINREALKSGVEIIITNDFLSEIFQTNINIDDITKKFMMDKIRQKITMSS
jgi:hypothetical protein